MSDSDQARSFLKLQAKFLDKTTNDEKVTLLKTLNPEEWRTENDGISFLNWIIEETIDKDFSLFWEEIKPQLTLEDLQAIEQTGPNEGTTLLWRLAFAVDESPEAFLCAWEHFKNELTIEDLHFAPQSGSFNKQSLLSLLANTASKTFYNVLEYFKPQLTKNEVSPLSQEDTFEKQTILWHLAYAVGKKPEAFLSVWEDFKAQITIEDLRVAPQKGELKGYSILWLLAVAAGEENPEAFLRVLEYFKEELTIEDIRTIIVDEDDKIEQPLLGYLSAAAVNDKPEAFLAIWELFKEEFTIEDLPLFLDKDSQSPLLEFLELVADKAPQAFLDVWERFKDELTVEQVNSIIHNGTAPKASLLWLLAFTSDTNPEAFLSVWEHFKPQLTIENMRFAQQSGPYQGLTLLWFLAYAADENPEVFLTVWDHFKTQLMVEDILKVSPGSGHQESILKLLAFATSKGNNEAFINVWEHFKADLTIENMRFVTQDGVQLSILRDLAYATYKERNPEAFLAVWKQFKMQFTIEDIRATPKDSTHSILWFLASVADGKPQAFLAVWEHLKDKLIIEDLRVKPENADMELSAIGYLAFAIGNRNPEAFLSVFDKFKRELKIEDFFSVKEDGHFYELPMFYNLTLQPKIKSQASKLTFEMLTQLPGELKGLLTPKQLNSLKNILSQDVQAFVDTRNAFFKALQTFHTKEVANPDGTIHAEKIDSRQMDALAQAALDVGYINAFYDLGNSYENLGQLNQAFEYYQQVPKESIHFQHVQKKLADAFYHEALASKDEDRTENLTLALRCAVNCEPETGIKLIRLIAFSYVKGNQSGLDQLDVINHSTISLIKSVLIANIDSETLFTQCQGILEAAKASFEQQQTLQDVKTEIEVLRNINQNLADEISTLTNGKTENIENDVLSAAKGIFFALSNKRIVKTTENRTSDIAQRMAAPAV